MKKLLFSQPMLARDPEEEHRGATSLELLFDLVSVIAIAAAATGLHHSIAEAHYVQGLISFFAAFFMVWWAWMNFTWFASAYDNDDTLSALCGRTAGHDPLASSPHYRTLRAAYDYRAG